MHPHPHKGSNIDGINKVHIIHGTLNHNKPKKNPYNTALSSISLVGWLIVVAAGYFLAKARPPAHFDRQFNSLPSNIWNETYLEYCFYTLCVTLVISCIGLLINAIGHHKQKRFFYRANLVFMMILSLCGIAFYLLR